MWWWVLTRLTVLIICSTHIKSLCCTPETNIMLYLSYTSIFKNLNKIKCPFSNEKFWSSQKRGKVWPIDPSPPKTWAIQTDCESKPDVWLNRKTLENSHHKHVHRMKGNTIKEVNEGMLALLHQGENRSKEAEMTKKNQVEFWSWKVQ